MNEHDHQHDRHHDHAHEHEGEIDGEVIVGDELDAEAQARRRLALAQIRQYPDPVLRMKAREVGDFGDDLLRLVVRMRQLMKDAHGVGLAATQIGILQRVFVFQRGEDDIVAVVNPVIVERSEEVETDDEGCLSLQGVLAPVERNVSLTLSGKDPDGNDLRLELEGHPARVVQHEVDHLDGKLLIDRIDSESRKAALAILRPRPILAAV
ncbi:MAG: peptide deformylase [Gaiellaceae bacterium]